MALIKCPECGKDISDKAQSCPHCGNPMLSLFEKPVPVNDNHDQDEMMRYLELARRARDDNNSENAARYYDLVLQKAPLSWEASFYQVYFSAMNCKLMNLSNAAYSVGNCLDSVAHLIVTNEKQEDQEKAWEEVKSRVALIASLFTNWAINHYNQFSNLDSSLGECSQRIIAISAIYESLVKATQKNFPEKEKDISTCAKMYIDYISDKGKFVKSDWISNEISAYAPLVQKSDSSYVPPTVSGSSSGCYIATCVYGSYNCPQVWTLRRFRDNTLKASVPGRLFIRFYYTISPSLVRWFGNKEWFRRIFRKPLDRMVERLRAQGVENTPYEDK